MIQVYWDEISVIDLYGNVIGTIEEEHHGLGIKTNVFLMRSGNGVVSYMTSISFVNKNDLEKHLNGKNYFFLSKEKAMKLKILK